jgi:hypothetical protein
MSFTYTPTNRFFITNPYNSELDLGHTPFTSQQILTFFSNMDFQDDGYIIISEYIHDGKYKYSVIAFSHDIWTPTGKITKYFKQALDPKPYIDHYIPSGLSETTYENWNS